MNANADSRRILVLTSTFPRWRGDTEPAFVFELCRHLAALGHRVTVLAPHAPGAARYEKLDAVEVRRFRYAPEAWEALTNRGGIMANLKRNPFLYALLPFFVLAQLAALARLLRGQIIDAVHAHWIVPQGLCLAAGRGFAREVRTVCTVHGSDVAALRGPFWAALRRWTVRRTDCVATVGASLREQLLSEGCSSGRIEVAPMGVDLHNRFVPNAGSRSVNSILFVGRLVPEKGADVLIRALPRILAAHPDVVLTMVGDGPQRNWLAQLAKTLDVESRIEFLGALPHAALAEHYRRAALLVVPSLREGFGLVAVEALGCGCAVAASDIPSLRDILADGQAGRLFAAGDVEELASTVREMLDDPSLSREMGRHGRALAEERYSWPAVALRYAALLAPEGG